MSDSDHLIQLFDAPESLGSAVAAFLAEGIRDDANLLVVARAAHVRAISEGLTALGYSMASLVGAGRLTVLDARTTMRGFMPKDRVDAALFEQTVGDTVRGLAATSGALLRVYGEMVDVLAEEQNYEAVTQLEGLWNELGTSTPFCLLCGYASSHFVSASVGDHLRSICQQHTRLLRGAGDVLANYVLETTLQPAG